MTLKDIPENFDIDSEDEVRFAIANYFKELDFNLDELSFEDHFTIQLGRSRFTAENGYRKGNSTLNQVHGYSDLLLVRNGQPLAIVEIKRLDHDLDDNDAWQAISYARLLRRRIAPYAIITNGKETRVYDPLADSDELVRIDDPSLSVWNQKGQSLPAIGDDLKFEATRKLIGINPHTLHTFCQNQVGANLEEIKGSPNQFKLYVPELYLPRQKLKQELHQWLDSDMPCFALVGESGVGKTNFMCATVEEQLKDNFVLFYSAQYLKDGLKGAIVNDFVWEFRRESNIVHIVERFDDIASTHGKKLIIFIDALDEFIGNQGELISELRDFVPRISGNSVRLCISCKAYDWERYAIANGQNYSQLATLTYPKREQVHNPKDFEKPNFQNVGVWLGKFTDAELENVFKKYKEVFSLQGDLTDEARIECEMPLMLRLMAEVYAGQTESLPSKISSRKLFDEYWRRKLAGVSTPVSAELILTTLAKLMVESNLRQIAVQKLGQEIGMPQFDEQTYQDLVRFGLVRQSLDRVGFRKLSFGFEKLRNYVYSVFSKGWGDKSSSEVAQEIVDLLREPNQLIIEAIDFYLTVVDQGETEILTNIALTDLRLFIDLVSTDYDSSALESSVHDSSAEEKSHLILNRLVQYTQAYSKLSRHYFPNLCTRIVPYTKGEVGVWVNEGSVMYQFRSVTPEYPQPIIITAPDITSQLTHGTAHPQLLNDLGNPAGTIQMGAPDLSKQLPQKVAWNRLMVQIAELFEKSLLDETNTPAVLQERIREVLLLKPDSWFGDISDRTKNYQKLGFDSEETIFETRIDELHQRTNEPMENYLKQLEELNLTDKTLAMRSPTKRWYLDQIGYFYLLQYWLSALKQSQNYLRKADFDLETIFKSIRNPDAAVPIFKKLLPKIIEAYQLTIEQNFASIADWFKLYKFRDCPVLIEATHNDKAFWSSDYLDIRYILLTTTKLQEKYIVYSREKQFSLANQELMLPVSFRMQEIRGFGSRFGQASISIDVDGYKIIEPKAFIYRTRFPSRNPISDQIYQLISAEARLLLSGGSNVWSYTDSPSVDYQHLAWLVSQQK